MGSFNVSSKQLWQGVSDKFGSKFDFQEHTFSLRKKLGRKFYVLVIIEQNENFKEIYLNECILVVFVACCYDCLVVL